MTTWEDNNDEHAWFESSDTTQQCERCGLVAYGVDEQGESISWRRRHHVEFGGMGGVANSWPKTQKQAPECVS